jgi:hypothetical protein
MRFNRRAMSDGPLTLVGVNIDDWILPAGDVGAEGYVSGLVFTGDLGKLFQAISRAHCGRIVASQL